jgi:RHS repeat-associated protein
MDTFGSLRGSTGSTPNPYRFGAGWGYMTDPSGFLQLGARYYWPEVGRFVSQDPVVPARNRYAYVRNNPVVRLDPTGLWSLTGGGYVGGVGGEVTIGANPDGGWFFGVHGGVGTGGGVSFDRRGTSPGWRPCARPGLGGWLGVSAAWGASAGPVGIGSGRQKGYLFEADCGPRLYSSKTPNTSFSPSKSFGGGGSLGIDVGFVGTPWPF